MINSYESSPGFPTTKQFASRFLSILFRRWVRLSFLFLFLTLLFGLMIFLMIPTYDGVVKLLVQANPTPKVTPFQDVAYPPVVDPRVNRALEVIEIVQSRKVGEAIVKEFSLDELYRRTREEPDDLRDSIKKYYRDGFDLAKELLALMLEMEVEPSNDFEEALEEFREESLSANLVEDTQIIEIQVSERSPELSTQIANRVAALAIARMYRLIERKSNKALEFSTKRFAEIERSYNDAMAAMADFKKEMGVVALQEEIDIKLQNLSELENQLALAEADHREVGARYAQIQSELHLQEPKLLRRDLLEHLQYESVENRIALAAAEGKKQSLEKSMEHANQELLQLREAEVRYARLSQTLADAEDVYREFANNIVKLRIQKGNQLNELEFRMLADAYVSPDAEPDSPRLLLSFLIVLFLAASGSLALVLLGEYLSGGAIDLDELEEEVGVPVAGGEKEL